MYSSQTAGISAINISFNHKGLSSTVDIIPTTLLFTNIDDILFISEITGIRHDVIVTILMILGTDGISKLMVFKSDGFINVTYINEHASIINSGRTSLTLVPIHCGGSSLTINIIKR